MKLTRAGFPCPVFLVWRMGQIGRKDPPPPEKGEYEGVGIQGGEKDGHKKISEQERLETTKEKQEKRKLRVSKTGWSIKV